MNCYIKRISAAVLTMTMLSAAPAYAAGESSQIINLGGTAGSLERDGVEVSKTISETGIENYFDITLTAKAGTDISSEVYDGDLAVVLVLDLSNTMNYAFGTSETPKDGEDSRYDAAMKAAETFISGFETITADNCGADRRIGIAAFNTGGHAISQMMECKTRAQSAAIADDMRSKTAAIIGAEDYRLDKARFTNMEAGLKVAKDMLAGIDEIDEKNKIIIFITDGYPTTYLKDLSGTDYAGYEPYSTAGDVTEYGVFYDGSDRGGVYCSGGADYSDRAALRAAAMAMGIRNSGVDIYSVGVDLEGQSMAVYEEKNYGEEGMVSSKALSTIDTINGDYVIDDFAAWLGGEDTDGGIASGAEYYYPCESTAQLVDALGSIFNSINSDRSISVTAQSVLDPVFSKGMGDYIEFVGFFAKSGRNDHALTEGNLIGSCADWDTEGAENTAALFELDEKNTINWDLTRSAYDVTESEGENNYGTVYTYTLKYRIRLKNEAAGFSGSGDYCTNDTTILTYEHTEKEGQQTIEYPLPVVNGFFGQLAFKKVDSVTGKALSGAEFTLKHSGECTECIAGGCDVVMDEMRGVSDDKGNVSFDRIPSGHSYTLTETKAPDMHHTLRDIYTVKVSYGKTDIFGDGKHFRDTLEGVVISNDLILPGDVTATVSLKKLLNGNTPPDGRFEFSLTDEAGNVITSKATGGEASFLLNFKGTELDADKAYRYTLRELKHDSGYIYDDAVYTVIIAFEKCGADYAAKVTYYKGENVSEDAKPISGTPIFYNRTRSSGPPLPPIITVPPKTGGFSGLGLAMGLMFMAIAIGAQGRNRRGGK